MPTFGLADCINEACAWSGKPVQADSLTKYGGRVVGSRNPDCGGRFETAIRRFEDARAARESADRPDREPRCRFDSSLCSWLE